MALSSTAITTLARAKGFLRLNDVSPSFHRAGLDIYYDRNVGGGSDATVEVRENDLVLSSTGDASSTVTYDLTNVGTDTIAELVIAIVDQAGSAWTATALYHGDADTVDFIETASTSAFGIANRQTLNIVNNRFVELLIEAVTIEIETWLGRDVASRDYTELHNIRRAGGIKEIVLRHPDVLAITRVSLDSLRVLTLTYTGTNTSARFEVSDTAVRTISQTVAAPTDTTSLFTASATTALMQITLDGISDWTCVLIDTVPTEHLVREGARDALGIVVDLHAWADFEGTYVVDYEAGTLDFGSYQWPFGLSTQPTAITRLQVEYTAGFATIPADIDLIAIEMVASMFHNVARDNTLQSESLGDYSYTLRSSNGQAVEWQRRLEKYRRFLP